MAKLPPPETQLQEVLYELLTRSFIDRRTMMLHCDVMNLTACITSLRRKGCKIQTKPLVIFNKYKRIVESCTYKLDEKEKARYIYFTLKANQNN